jgi:hypothetical protein
MNTIDALDALNKDTELIEKDSEDFIYTYFTNEQKKIDLKSNEKLFLKKYMKFLM